VAAEKQVLLYRAACLTQYMGNWWGHDSILTANSTTHNWSNWLHITVMRRLAIQSYFLLSPKGRSRPCALDRDARRDSNRYGDRSSPRGSSSPPHIDKRLV